MKKICNVWSVKNTSSSWLSTCAASGKGTTEAAFQINSTTLYVPVVTLSINYNIKSLKNTKQGFQRTIYWNKYRPEITALPKNNNLDYLIDPTFTNIITMFEL